MSRTPPLRTLIAAVALCIAAVAAFAQTAQQQAVRSATPSTVEQEEAFFNARVAGRIFRLEGLITKPRNAAGRLPIAILLHGKDFEHSEMERVRPRASARQARDLAERGWLVVSFTRRGFGRSDGPFPALASCTTLKPSDQFDADADEITAVLDILRQRPDADASRVVAIGVSAGGAAALALAARNPPGLKAVVNISGGLNLSSCVEKGNDALVEAVKAYAGRSRVPQLWIYADNDNLFPLALVNRMHEAALGAGGNIRRLSIEKLEPSGHNVWGSNVGRRTWLAELDKSLRSWDLPTFSPADVKPWLKHLEGANSNQLERYQADPGHKALVYSPSEKTFWWRFAVGSEADAVANATKDCEAKAKAKDCKVVLVGNALQTP
ncbi:MAG: alpha/beta hydrolase family protein [Beijerinckiaceae bacterium]